MAADYLLEIDGIKGESADAKHKGAIEVDSFSWGVTQSSSATAAGQGAGKVVFQDITFTSRLGAASPQLFLSCATGQHIKKAILTVRKAGGDQQEYYKVTLEDVLVSSLQQSAADDESGEPTDTFSLDFARIELEYTPQREDGSTDAPVKAGYDLKANKKL